MKVLFFVKMIAFPLHGSYVSLGDITEDAQIALNPNQISLIDTRTDGPLASIFLDSSPEICGLSNFRI